MTLTTPDERQTSAGDPRCPTCHRSWELFPPAKIHGHNAYRCVECKAVYTGEQRAAPDMLAALGAIVHADNSPLVMSDSHSRTLIDAARSALSRAKGERT